MLLTTVSGSSLPSTVMYQSSSAFNRRNHSRTSLSASSAAGLSDLFGCGLAAWERPLREAKKINKTKKKNRLSIVLDSTENCYVIDMSVSSNETFVIREKISIFCGMHY